MTDVSPSPDGSLSRFSACGRLFLSQCPARYWTMNGEGDIAVHSDLFYQRGGEVRRRWSSTELWRARAAGSRALAGKFPCWEETASEHSHPGQKRGPRQVSRADRCPGGHGATREHGPLARGRSRPPFPVFVFSHGPAVEKVLLKHVLRVHGLTINDSLRWLLAL